jgi:hypothetical protein
MEIVASNLYETTSSWSFAYTVANTDSAATNSNNDSANHLFCFIAHSTFNSPEFHVDLLGADATLPGAARS